MKIDDLRKSDNVEDRRSSSGGSFSSGGSDYRFFNFYCCEGVGKPSLWF